ncbi:carbonic anhydrase [Acidisoma sp. S159]|uniref:carbonic anhydrase n=1 Tax=Acidisoma sp. S159 TaxID=1747225 RepID=UPI001C205BBE|nr:carbonic anhydrase [Acidisoma sp. S159]
MRFVAKQLTSFQEDLDILKQNTVAKQEPFAAVLACADSRVPVELVFDQSIGHVFVTRVAGNIASAEIIASLEYGAAVLGTRTILVLAHSGCGAVKAAMAGKAVPGQISTLYRFIRPAIDRANGDLTVAEKVNAMIQAGLLRDASPVLSDLVKQGKLSIAAAYYDLGTGKVTLLA